MIINVGENTTKANGHNRQTDKQIDGQTDGHTDEQTDRRTDRHTKKGGHYQICNITFEMHAAATTSWLLNSDNGCRIYVDIMTGEKIVVNLGC